LIIKWKFVLDCWNIRNDNEHDNEGDKIGRMKEKLSSEILWHIKSKANVIPTKYVNMSKMNLMELPIENLKIMVEQLKILKSTK
jgi:hypothetical protein